MPHRRRLSWFRLSKANDVGALERKACRDSVSSSFVLLWAARSCSNSLKNQHGLPACIVVCVEVLAVYVHVQASTDISYLELLCTIPSELAGQTQEALCPRASTPGLDGRLRLPSCSRLPF